MNLDVNTLFLVTIYVEAILGLLLLFAWAQNTAIAAVALWGFAHLLRAASVTLFGLYGSVSDLISIDLANAILFTSFAVTWTGSRLFDHRKPQYVFLFAGAVCGWSSAGFRDSPIPLTCGCFCPPASSPLTPGRLRSNSGAAVASPWFRAGRRSSCCSRTARFICCARRSEICCRGSRATTRCWKACGSRCS